MLEMELPSIYRARTRETYLFHSLGSTGHKYFSNPCGPCECDFSHLHKKHYIIQLHVLPWRRPRLGDFYTWKCDAQTYDVQLFMNYKIDTKLIILCVDTVI